MTWGEVKLAALQKMFSAESLTVNENDESVRTYIYGMPQAANEAMQLLCTTGKFLRRCHEFALPAGQGATVDLKTELPDFYSTGPFELYVQSENLAPLYGARLLGGRFLTLPAVEGTHAGEQAAARVLFFYNAWPAAVTHSTPDSEELPLDAEVAVLLPLYMASQLYKDDDVSIATQYRNEFEAARELLVNGESGIVGGDFTSVTGWW